jgi:hypothetical protein
MKPQILNERRDIRFALTEQPRSITDQVPNPNYDIRTLY